MGDGDAMISKEMFQQMMDSMDKDGDGTVTKAEFKIPWKKIFPKMSEQDFEGAWATIDRNGDGELSLRELADHYGYQLSPSGKRAGDADMTDEQILEALQMQQAMEDLRLEQEAIQSRKKAEAEAAAGAASRRGSGMGVADRAKRTSSAGVTTIKMPAKVTQTTDDPNILFLQMCELGDEKGMLEAMKVATQEVRMEDDKGEMPLHKLARQGATESIRAILERSAKVEAVKTDLNWQDKQGKTPIFYAAEYGHTKLVQLFLDRGADCMVENNNGWTVLHAAVNADKLDCVSAILDNPRVREHKKTLLAFPDKSKRVALHIAAFKSREGEMVALLLRHGADSSVVDAAGNTGAKLAGKTGRRKSKELLEEHQAMAVERAAK